MSPHAPVVPWAAVAAPHGALARVVAAMDRQREPLRQRFPNLPVPDSGIGSFRATRQFTVWGLITLWEELPTWWTGTCPACSGSVRGLRAGGRLAAGGLLGICLACGLGHRRAVAGVAELMLLVPRHVRYRLWRGHPYRDIHADTRAIVEGLGLRLETAPEFVPDLEAPRQAASWDPILAALDALGEVGLRDPQAQGPSSSMDPQGK